MDNSTGKSTGLWSWLQPQSRQFDQLEHELQDQCATPIFLPFDFLKAITGNFSEQRELRRDGFGVVYKGVLKNGKALAVKKLQCHNEFEAGVGLLGEVRHPNLNGLRAYHLGQEEAFVVFDYMPKGSISAALFHAQATNTPVDWATRIATAKGVARGLAYLHDDMSIIHGNLTARNVLFDEQSQPKMADFGLFRFMTAATNYNVLAVARELGCCAPELFDLMKASAKTDVYSLGIIILQLLTGKLLRGMGMLPQWVGFMMSEGFMSEVFGLELRGKDVGPSADELVATLMLALQCVDPSPSVRPQAREVLAKLEKICPGLENATGPSKDPSPSVQLLAGNELKQVRPRAPEDGSRPNEDLSPPVRTRRRELEHPEHIRQVMEDGAGLSEHLSPLVLEDVQEAMEQPGQIEGREVFQQLEHFQLGQAYGASHHLDGHVDDQSVSRWRQQPADLFKESHSMVMDHSNSGLPTDIPFSLLENITNGFSKECRLGSGAFGEVYKGTFGNGNVIAVKKLFQMHLDNDDQFRKEVTYLLNLKHQNIVQLIGYCAESKYVSTKLRGRYVVAEVQQRLLCFEYLNNGSLREHLSDESCGLEWHIRYEVIRGICCGLHYLHTECNIVHLDLKPTNILLDHNMMPKVADFGISRLFGDQQSGTITATIKGTFGYMAPEYINNGLISYKADIFSLGVIIIEVMTGYRGYPYSTGGEACSVPFAENVIANWRKRFETKARHISSEKYIEQVKTCITIGLMCVDPEPNKRPSVGDINRMLNILPQTQTKKQEPVGGPCHILLLPNV